MLSALESLNIAILKAMDKTKEVSFADFCLNSSFLLYEKTLSESRQVFKHTHTHTYTHSRGLLLQICLV